MKKNADTKKPALMRVCMQHHPWNENADTKKPALRRVCITEGVFKAYPLNLWTLTHVGVPERLRTPNVGPGGPTGLQLHVRLSAR